MSHSLESQQLQLDNDQIVPSSSSISTSARDSRLFDLPVSQQIAGKWNAIAMSHLLIQSTTSHAVQDKPLDTFQLYSMLEGMSLFSMKFSQCPVPVDLLAVKSNSFCPPQPPDLDRNLLAKHLHYSLLDWKMSAEEEVEEFKAANQLHHYHHQSQNDETKATSNAKFHHSNNNNIIPWDKFFHEADEELTKLIQAPSTYEFRHPENVSTKRAAPSFGVEGFAASVFWLCVIQQAQAESRQNKAINETLSIQHRKKHRYDAEVGDLVWRQVLFEVLRPSELTMMKGMKKNDDDEEDDGVGDDQQQNQTTTNGNLGDALLRSNIIVEAGAPKKSSRGGVSLSNVIRRVGGHLTKDATLLLKLLISGDVEPEAGKIQDRITLIQKNNSKAKLQSHQQHHHDEDSISLEDALHLLCVKRVCDIDDSLLLDLERWCERRVALWLIERFSPLDFPSCSISSTVGGDPARKHFRPYLLRCFFKIVSTAVARVITRLFNGTVTGGKVSQKDVWSKIRTKLDADDEKKRKNLLKNNNNGGKNNDFDSSNSLPPEVIHAKIVQHNIEQYLISVASLAPVNTNQNSIPTSSPRVKSSSSTSKSPSSLLLPSSTRSIKKLRPHPPPSFSSSSQLNLSSTNNPVRATSPLSSSAAVPAPSSPQLMNVTSSSSSLVVNTVTNANLTSTAPTSSSKSLTQQMKDSIKSSLSERKLAAAKQSTALKNFTNIVLTDDEAAVRRDIALRAAARKRTIALEEGDDLIEGQEGSEDQQKPQQQGHSFSSSSQNQNEHKRTRRPNRYVGWDLADKGIAIGDDSDYRKNLSTRSSTAMMLRNSRVFNSKKSSEKTKTEKTDTSSSSDTSDDNDENNNDDDLHHQILPEQSSRSILASIAKIGTSSNSSSGSGGTSGGGGGGGIVSASFEAKLQQQRAMSARQSVRSVIDADRRALASHFGDLKHVIKVMDRARMQQLLQLQQFGNGGSSNNSNSNANNTSGDGKESANNLAVAALNNALQEVQLHQYDENGGNAENNNNSRPNSSSRLSPSHQSRSLKQTSFVISKEAQLQAKIFAAARVKEMQENRPRTASASSATRRNASRGGGEEESSSLIYDHATVINLKNRLPIRGLSKCAEASLRDAEEVVGNIFNVRPPERTIALTPRATNIRSSNLKRAAIRLDLEGCLRRTEMAERKTEAEKHEEASELIMTHFNKRSLSNQSQADLERTVSVVADRVRAESARKRAQKNSERKWLIQSLRDEIRQKLLMSEAEITKRCSTGMRTQEYYAALHSCKQRIDDELLHVLPATTTVNSATNSGVSSMVGVLSNNNKNINQNRMMMGAGELFGPTMTSSSSSPYEYTIKERNTLRELAMIIHRLMCYVRRNYPEEIQEFEEFELRRKGRRNAAVKRDAEFL